MSIGNDKIFIESLQQIKTNYSLWDPLTQTSQENNESSDKHNKLVDSFVKYIDKYVEEQCQDAIKSFNFYELKVEGWLNILIDSSIISNSPQRDEMEYDDRNIQKRF